jgi:hypothetical protein
VYEIKVKVSSVATTATPEMQDATNSHATEEHTPSTAIITYQYQEKETRNATALHRITTNQHVRR